MREATEVRKAVRGRWWLLVSALVVVMFAAPLLLVERRNESEARSCAERGGVLVLSGNRASSLCVSKEVLR